MPERSADSTYFSRKEISVQPQHADPTKSERDDFSRKEISVQPQLKPVLVVIELILAERKSRFNRNALGLDARGSVILAERKSRFNRNLVCA